MTLLHWNKELPYASAADPLGLNLRVSARLAAELFHCITSITPRARYYSFFPWAFQDYADNEHAKSGDRGRVQGVLSREKAMVLGAVMHHEGGPCRDGSLGGSDKAIELTKTGPSSYELASWKHLKAAEGQFGAAYKASLINLGLFQTETKDVDDEVDAVSGELDENMKSVEVMELSPLGKRLASAYRDAVVGSRYVAEHFTRLNRLTADVLSEFGSVAGLCEILTEGAQDRDVLRNVFFTRYEDMTHRGHQRRRMSLLLLLDCIGQCQQAAVAFGHDAFSDICYFEALVDEDDQVISAPSAPALKDIHQRWRVFYTQHYLAVALQSMLIACVRALRGKTGGTSFDALVEVLNPPGMDIRFRECFDRSLPQDFFALTARQTLAVCEVEEQDGEFRLNPIDGLYSERRLEGLLIEAEANDAACIALATMLLYQVVVRYEERMQPPLNNWYKQQVHNDLGDISLPGMLQFLRSEFGDTWLDRTNGELLKRILSRFVIRQHERMSYERGFGGGAPLFNIDGATIIGTGVDFTHPSAFNGRLASALQILVDLGLIVRDIELAYRRTPEGDAWLATELQSASAK